MRAASLSYDWSFRSLTITVGAIVLEDHGGLRRAKRLNSYALADIRESIARYVASSGKEWP